MQNRGLAASTIKTDLGALRFFHDKIPNAKHILPDNDKLNLEKRKFGGVDRCWSEREYELMLAECKKAGREDYVAIITIARHVGLRVHEIFRLDTATVRLGLKTGILVVRGKGGLIRQVPINETTKLELEKSLKLVSSGQKLFVDPGDKTHLAIKRLQNFIHYHKKFVQDEGSTKPMTMHGLRHSYASENYQKLIASGKSEYEARKQVSEWLGHHRDEITRIYTYSAEVDSKDGEDDV